MAAKVKPIRSVLIANRGEVAVRVAGTLRDMGIRSIVVYTDADKDAPFTRVGDTAVPLGGDRGYLDIAAIVNAAKAAGADAIHPGYGFLAESAPFAAAVAEAGIKFIGPDAKTISNLGSKIGAKKILASSAPDVPLVPGFYPKSGEADLSPSAWRAKADSIGYPVLIKAAAGGGGKGMRVVRDSQSFEESLDSVRTEAKQAFGDDTVMLERYFEGVRHIEVQILGDRYGNVDHLGERECSVQRRHQKLLEESPSPALSGTAREKICRAAVQVGKAVNYECAGTIEFIVEAEGSNSENPKFYFLECNTRLQVEHAVTEQCRGVDIVKMQVLIASGMALADAAAAASRRPTVNAPMSKVDNRNCLSSMTCEGFSIEARVYAEDDAFMPCVGTVTAWRPAEGVAFYHSATDVGSKLGVTYDGLVAKVIVFASESREAARTKLVVALKQLVCFGVYTNRAVLINLLNHPRVVSGDMTTDMIDKKVIDSSALSKTLPSTVYQQLHDNDAALLLQRAALIAEGIVGLELRAQRKVWSNIPSRWSNNSKSKVIPTSKSFVLLPKGSQPAPPTTLTVTRSGDATQVSLQPDEKSESKTAVMDVILKHVDGIEYEAQFGGGPIERVAVQVNRSEAVMSQCAMLPDGGASIAAVCYVQFLENGNVVALGLKSRSGPTGPVTGPSRSDDSLPSSFSATAGSGPAGKGEVRSPIPAKVVKLVAQDGSTVKAGDVVIVLESMKMERKLTAPSDGVLSISLKPGDLIQPGNTVFTVKEK